MDSDVELYAPINTGRVTASNGQAYKVLNGMVKVPGSCVAALLSSGYRPRPASEVALGGKSAGDIGVNKTIYVAASRTLLASDNGATLECAADITLTVPPGFPQGFSAAVIANGTTSIAAGSGVLLNGAGTTVTRAAASNAMFAIVGRASLPDSYVISGS